MKSLYRFLSSIKLTILLTYLIVFISITGSFVILYSSEAFEVIDSTLLIDWLKKSHPAASWWIILLIALLVMFSINAVFCTYDRVFSLVRAWRGKFVRKDEEEDSLVTEDIERGRGIRLRTLLPYIAHIGFLIALAGHLAGSLWGFRGGDINAAEGETVAIRETGNLSLKIGELDMRLSRMGYPEEMKGKVSLLSDGKVVREKVIEINSPLLYKDLAVYIKNIQTVPEGLIVKKSGGGRDTTFLLTPGSGRSINDSIRIAAGRMDRRYAAMEVMIFEGSRLLKRGWLSPYNPKLRSIDFGSHTISAEDVSLVNAGTFTVNRDPGAKLVFAGLTLFVISLIAHLFLRK